MPEWVFFDVGNVLYNDDRQSARSYAHFHRVFQSYEPGLTFADLMREREAEARQAPGWVLRRISQRRLPADRFAAELSALRALLESQFDEHHQINPGAAEVLAELAKSYRLGILANQPAECRASLARRNLLPYFQVVAISEELDLHKPDPEIFRWALEQAGCDPAQAVMVGDRQDNDIAPARAIGFRTVQVVWREKCWPGETDDDLLFLDSCRRVPVFSQQFPGGEPDAVIGELSELPGVLGGM